jgi:hypothetical protein
MNAPTPHNALLTPLGRWNAPTPRNAPYIYRGVREGRGCGTRIKVRNAPADPISILRDRSAPPALGRGALEPVAINFPQQRSNCSNPYNLMENGTIFLEVLRVTAGYCGTCRGHLGTGLPVSAVTDPT